MSTTPTSNISKRIQFTPAKGGDELTYEAFQDRLTEMEWYALVKLSHTIGEAPIAAALTALDTPALREFCQKALVDQAAKRSNAYSKSREVLSQHSFLERDTFFPAFWSSTSCGFRGL